MKAIQFDYSMMRYVLSKAAGKIRPSAMWNSRISCLRYQTDAKEPDLPNSQWVKIRVKYGGICGSDLNLIFLNDSPATSPYSSFPFTIGHELLGEITEVGSDVQNLNTGDRVVVDPLLSCKMRGISNPCPACRRGDYNLCDHKTDGDVSPGLLIGACRDTGGSWGEYLVAHQYQVFSLPAKVDDLNGLMVEPFSCALHSVMQNRPRDEDTVLVIGAGVIGICVIAAIRALGIASRIVVLAKHPFQAETAKRYGADETVQLTPGDTYFPELSERLDARLLKPLFGSPVVQSGADVVFECVGKKKSMEDALRFARNGGKVVVLGLASILEDIDWTTVWLNELSIKGSFAYGTEHVQGEKKRTHQVAIDLMESGKVDLAPLVTHRFPLDQYKRALQTALKKDSGNIMKVVLEP